MHTSRFSACSTMPPEEAIRMALKRGLDGIAFTEHGCMWDRAAIEELREKAGCPGFPVLAGCEISSCSDGCQTGDLLVFGAAEMPDEPLSIDAACRIAHRQGGIVIAPHPFAENIGLGEELAAAPVDAVELANYRYHDPLGERRVLQFCRERAIAAIASSDAHRADDVGRFCVETPIRITSEADLVRVIQQGLVRPRLKPPPGKTARALARLMGTR